MKLEPSLAAIITPALDPMAQSKERLPHGHAKHSPSPKPFSSGLEAAVERLLVLTKVHNQSHLNMSVSGKTAYTRHYETRVSLNILFMKGGLMSK